MKVSEQSLVLITAAGVGFIALLGWWSFSMIEKQFKFTISETLNGHIGVTQQAAASWVEENKHTVLAMAGSGKVVTLTKQLLATQRTPQSLINAPAQHRLREFFKPFLSAHHFRGFFIIGPGNISLGSTRDANTGSENLLVHQAEFLQSLWNGETIITNPQPSDVPLTDDAGRMALNYPTMFSGSAIRDENGQIIALLTLRINPFHDFIKIFQRGRMGETGEQYAFNREGIMISNSRFDVELRRLGILTEDQQSILNVKLRLPVRNIPLESPAGDSAAAQPLTLMAENALNNRNGVNIQGYLDYRGKKVVGAWRWDDELGLGLAAEQDFDEVFRPMATARYFFILFCALTVVGFVLMVMLFSRHSKEMIKEKQRYKILFENAYDSIFLVDLKTLKLIDVNENAAKRLGYEREELRQLGVEDINSSPLSGEALTILSQLQKIGSGIFEWQHKHRDGSLIPVEISSQVIEYDGRQTIQAFARDISERKKLDETIRRSQKMKAIGELSGGIAHDFNNLLGIIIGNLDLMKRKVEGDSTLQNQLEKAQKAALRGSILTRRLLNFSRQSPEAHSPVDVNKVLSNLEELVRKSLTANISVVVATADDLWMVELDPGDFEDAIINLSLNARDAMPNGGRLIIETRNTVLDRTTVNLKEEFEPGEYVEIAISDSGFGMPKEVSDQIFDPFFTTKENEKGTGLGLAMVYGFTQRAKGHISVYSEEGIGTTFRIYLPRSLSMAEQTEHPIENDISLPRGSETVLIVDDEKELTVIAKSILEDLGYTTICAYCGDEALHVLENNTAIDLLFSDVVMPGSLSGFDLADAALKLRPRLKILLTSGFTGRMQRTRTAEKWVKALITKPYRNVELAEKIRSTLDERR